MPAGRLTGFEFGTWPAGTGIVPGLAPGTATHRNDRWRFFVTACSAYTVYVTVPVASAASLPLSLAVSVTVPPAKTVTKLPSHRSQRPFRLSLPFRIVQSLVGAAP